MSGIVHHRVHTRHLHAREQVSHPWADWAAIRRTALIAAAVLAGFAALSVLLQLAYPRHRALPFKQIYTVPVGLKSEQQIMAALNDLNKRELQLKVGDEVKTLPLAEAGLRINAEATAQQVLHYSTLERLVPFSAIFEMTRWRETGYAREFDQAKAREQVAKLLENTSRAAVDATIKLENGKAVVSESKPGASYEVGQVLKLLEAMPLVGSTAVSAPPKVVMPTYQSEALQAVAAEAEKRAGQPVALTVDELKFTIDAATHAGWLRFTPDPAQETMTITYDAAAVIASLEQIALEVYKAPRQTIVSTVDGRVTSRTAGEQGRMLNVDTAAEAIIAKLNTGETSVVLSSSPIDPKLFRSRVYSPTNTGLSVLLQDWAAEYGASRYGVHMQELAGRRRSAGFNQDRSFVSASVYKIFLAYATYHKITAGTVNPGTILSTDTSIATCLDQMIIVSSNPCAHAVGNYVGWNAVTDMVRAAGFGSTSVLVGDFSTTPADTSRFLEKLEGRSILSESDSVALLEDMKRQIYRTGIPLGSKGIAVADKVGYVDGYRHDVGIVYHPKGTYALAVFSYGGSNAGIAELARRVNNWMNQ